MSIPRWYLVHQQTTPRCRGDANIVLTFSENVVKGSGNIVLYKTDSTLVQTIDVNSGLVIVSGTGVTINPIKLGPAQGYYLHIVATAFDDAGQFCVGISNSSPILFLLTQ